MKRDGLALAFGLACLLAAPGLTRAQDPDSTVTDLSGITSHRFQNGVIVDVLPREAVIFIDGRPVGTGRELIARATPVTPGWHTLAISAAGFVPYVHHFFTERRDSYNDFVVVLVPQ